MKRIFILLAEDNTDHTELTRDLGIYWAETCELPEQSRAMRKIVERVTEDQL